MPRIHPTACIQAGAEIADDVEIGPFCIVERDVTIAAECRLIPHVYVGGHTSIGARTAIYPFASLGTPPQSVKYRGGPTRLVIGAGCEIRESVTMNIGTEADRGVAEVGERCFIMVGVHIAHDCHVGNDVTMANNVVLGGHVTVGDSAVFGGSTAAPLFARIGRGVM